MHLKKSYQNSKQHMIKYKKIWNRKILLKKQKENLTEENLDKLSNLLDNANIEDKYKLSYISKYDKLLNDYTKKLEEEEQAKYAAKLQAATKAVEKAETSKNQTDVDNARSLANSLKATDKSNLNARLDEIQKTIDDKKTEEEKQAEYQS